MKFRNFVCKLILIVMVLNCVLPTPVTLAANEPKPVDAAKLVQDVDTIPAQNPVWYSADLELGINSADATYDDSVQVSVVASPNGGVDVVITHMNREGDKPVQLKVDIGEDMVATSDPSSPDYWYTTQVRYGIMYDGTSHIGDLVSVGNAGVGGNEATTYTYHFESLSSLEIDEITAAIESGNDGMTVSYSDRIEYRPNIDSEIANGKRESGVDPQYSIPPRTTSFTKLDNVRGNAAVTKDEGGLPTVEELFSMLLNGIANALNKLIALAVGHRVTIDDIVFNLYPPVIVDYFADIKEANYSELIWGPSGDGNGGLAETVNMTYSFFQKIAIIAYMIMLIYMGIRILLASTGESLSQYKTLFMYWVMGIAILFLYPYVMKYTIVLNNAFVSLIAENRFYGQDNQYTIVPSTLPPATINDSTKTILDINFESHPFEQNGNDYMSQIANDAQNGKRLAMALAYLILTWQLITLIVHYYKRLFLVGFLIAIFPIVTMFYAVDRIADGKSQAFNRWNKEFMLNVLIQSFHAIVYVFVCSTVYATYDTNFGFDFILVITGVTFMFTGEEIIKKIFSQDSPSKVGGGLKDTMAQIAKTTVAVGVAKKAVGLVAGKNSIPANVMAARANVKAADAKLNAFDKMAQTVEAPNAGLRLSGAQEAHANIDANTSLTDEQKRAQKAEATRLANAVATLNNPNSRSAEELARARQIVDQARAADPSNVILRDLRLSQDQMDDMQAIGTEMAHMVANGVMDPLTIDRHVRARLGYTLNGMSEAEQDKYRHMLLTGLAFTGASRYADPLESARNEVEATYSALENVMNGFTYRSKDDALDAAEEARKRDIRDRADEWARSFHEDGEDATVEEKELARSLMVIANRGSGLYTAKDYLDATSRIKHHMGGSEEAQAMAETLDVDVDLLRHMMAHKVQDEGTDHYNRSRVRTIINTYESDVRENVFDDEVSGHELVELLFEDDEDARNAKMQQIIDDMANARASTNATESAYVRDIAADILAQEHVDITEGGMSESGRRYLNGQTREDILRERRQAKWNTVRNLAGILGYNETSSAGGYSQEYLDEMKAYQTHFMGDQPSNEE